MEKIGGKCLDPTLYIGLRKGPYLYIREDFRGCTRQLIRI